MPTRHLATARLSSFSHSLPTGYEWGGTIQATIVSTFFEESQNDEIENSGSVCHVRFIHCCSCFFRGDTGSIFEHRKTLSAGDTAKRCSHLGGRWNGPAAATDTAALARGSVLARIIRES